MNWLLNLLVFINIFWLGYLTYIVYKKILIKPVNTKVTDFSKSTKISLVRFNPFDDLGGDQSFILCLLDNTNSGAIITSLHTRDTTRVYAKAIKNGLSEELSLSKEETKALIKTVNS